MEPTASSNGPSVEVAQQSRPESPVNGADRPVGDARPEHAPHTEAGPAGPANTPMPVAAPIAVQPTSPLPTVQQVQAPPSQADDNPLVAADEDVIEKEWVDKAKKIVAQTKDDPHAQEKEVNKLQADYMKKRYGKEIKITSD